MILGDEDEEPESGEIIEEESKDQHEYYNKANSFFDNISCEATDPHGERITRSAERKLNSETFGITGNNRNYNRRGGYNKRGGDRDFVIIIFMIHKLRLMNCESRILTNL